MKHTRFMTDRWNILPGMSVLRTDAIHFTE